MTTNTPTGARSSVWTRDLCHLTSYGDQSPANRDPLSRVRVIPISILRMLDLLVSHLGRYCRPSGTELRRELKRPPLLSYPMMGIQTRYRPYQKDLSTWRPDTLSMFSVMFSSKLDTLTLCLLVPQNSDMQNGKTCCSAVTVTDRAHLQSPATVK